LRSQQCQKHKRLKFYINIIFYININQKKNIKLINIMISSKDHNCINYFLCIILCNFYVIFIFIISYSIYIVYVYIYIHIYIYFICCFNYYQFKLVFLFCFSQKYCNNYINRNVKFFILKILYTYYKVFYVKHIKWRKIYI